MAEATQSPRTGPENQGPRDQFLPSPKSWLREDAYKHVQNGTSVTRQASKYLRTWSVRTRRPLILRLFCCCLLPPLQVLVHTTAELSPMFARAGVLFSEQCYSTVVVPFPGAAVSATYQPSPLLLTTRANADLHILMSPSSRSQHKEEVPHKSSDPSSGDSSHY